MTIQHVAKVFDADGFHNATERLVLLEIAYKADRKGVLRYSQSEIAMTAGLARPTVGRWFAHFERVGILERVGHGRYQLHLEDDENGVGFEDLLAYKRPVTMAAGAREEESRLKAIVRPGQYIAYREDGWPILQTG